MRKAFTLVELLVTIAIIGILSTLAVVGLNVARQRARDAKRASDIKTILTALELYNNEASGYPSTATGTVLGVGDASTLCTGGWKALCDPSDTVFMGKVPVAPSPPDGPCSIAENDYTYNAAPDENYTLTFCLGRGTGYLDEGVHTAEPSGIR